MSIERRKVVYQGRVQGVGFRMTTNRLASGFAVSGHVRNLADGRVELVAQGKPAELGRFLEAIDRAFASMIRDREVESLSPESESRQQFTIR